MTYSNKNVDLCIKISVQAYYYTNLNITIILISNDDYYVQISWLIRKENEWKNFKSSWLDICYSKCFYTIIFFNLKTMFSMLILFNDASIKVFISLLISQYTLTNQKWVWKHPITIYPMGSVSRISQFKPSDCPISRRSGPTRSLQISWYAFK